jgi:hypothetical protein
MAQYLRSVTVKLPVDLFAQVQHIAEKQGRSFSNVLRELVTNGLTDRIHSENTLLLRNVVHGEMEHLLTSYFGSPERRLEVKPVPVPSDARRLALCRKQAG